MQNVIGQHAVLPLATMQNEKIETIYQTRIWVPSRGVLGPNWIPMLAQSIDERTLNACIQSSSETNLFTRLSEKQPLFTPSCCLNCQRFDLASFTSRYGRYSQCKKMALFSPNFVYFPKYNEKKSSFSPKFKCNGTGSFPKTEIK